MKLPAVDSRTVERMRKDFARIAAARRRSGEWNHEDERDVGTWVSELIGTGNMALIELCAAWLAEIAWGVMEREIDRYWWQYAQFSAVRPVLRDDYERRQADREWARWKTRTS